MTVSWVIFRSRLAAVFRRTISDIWRKPDNFFECISALDYRGSLVEYKGELVRWNDERGFGFIKLPSSEEKFFIHISALNDMPRRPIVGDIIYFQVERGEDGKARAKTARIEGLTETSDKTRPKKGGSGNLFIFGLWVVFLVLVLVSVSFFVYYRSVEEDFSGYKCEGKQYCSEMTCEEARFYVKNCPDVKIDGDSDGKPCEQRCGH